MAERYRKKYKDGKPHLLKEDDPWDEDLGKLHKKFGGGEETRNILGKNYEIGDKGFYRTDRDFIKKDENERGVLKEPNLFQSITGEKYSTYEPKEPKDDSAKSSGIFDLFFGEEPSSGSKEQISSHEETEESSWEDEELYDDDDDYYIEDDLEEPKDEHISVENNSNGNFILGLALGAAMLGYLKKQNDIMTEFKDVCKDIEENSEQPQLRNAARKLLNIGYFDMNNPEVAEIIKIVILLYCEENIEKIEDPQVRMKIKKMLKEIKL